MLDRSEPFDATDPKAEESARREESRQRREDLDALRAMMLSKTGRACLYRQLLRCHIYASAFAPGQSDLTSFQLGEENVGKRLMLDLQSASLDLYLQMLKEQRAEEKRLDDVRRTDREKREAEDEIKTLLPDLPPPAGWPGHVPPARPKS